MILSIVLICKDRHQSLNLTFSEELLIMSANDQSQDEDAAELSFPKEFENAETLLISEVNTFILFLVNNIVVTAGSHVVGAQEAAERAGGGRAGVVGGVHEDSQLHAEVRQVQEQREHRRHQVTVDE